MQDVTEQNNRPKIRIEYLKPLIKKILDDGIHSHYRLYKIPKRGKKGYRTICAPDNELKYVQREILAQFNSNARWFHSNAVTGFAPGTSIKLNALKQHQYINIKFGGQLDPKNFPIPKHRFLSALNLGTVKLDLSDAFGSISANHILENWPELIDINSEDKFLLLEICTLNGSLPQGAPTSPTLLNIALRKFDTECIKKIHNAYVNIHNINNDINDMAKQFVMLDKPIYTRYADDISISFDLNYFKPYWFTGIVRRACKKYGLILNDSKTRFMTKKHGRFVTGLNIVNATHICVPRKKRNKIRAMIFIASKELDNDKRESLARKIIGNISYVFSIDATHGAKLLQYAIQLNVIDKNIKIAGRNLKEIQNRLLIAEE